MQNGKLKVLNIIGWGRSGSTILGNVLGNCEGFFFGGELRNIWKQSLLKNRLCGCGVPLKECVFWNKVFNEAFGDLNNVNVQKIVNELNSSSRSRYALVKRMPFGTEYFQTGTKIAREEIKKLFLAIKTITKCEVIVDATKAPLYSYLLSLIDELDVYVIHLIRDPRGIAYSRKKKKIQPDSQNTIYMEQFNPFTSSCLWNVRNLLAESLWKNKNSRYLMIRYEDFANEPRKIVNDILDFISEENSKRPFVSDRMVQLGINHSVWGNPSRFKKGEVELQLDDEWKNKLSPFDKVISTLCTLPLLVKYGYRVN